MRVFWLGVVFCFAATAFAPLGSATPQDDNFLAMLADAGIPAHDGIPSVIAAGHEVCAELDSGQPASAIADKLANDAFADAPVNSLDQYQRSMVRFVQVSTRAFCPAHADGAAWHGGHRVEFIDDVVAPAPLPAIPGEPNVAQLKPPAVAAPPTRNPPRVKPAPPEQSPPPVDGPQGGGQSGDGQSGGGDEGGDGGAQPAAPLPGGHIVLLP